MKRRHEFHLIHTGLVMPKGEDGFVESPVVGIRAPCCDKRAQPSPGRKLRRV
jgi:hypothetical protein